MHAAIARHRAAITAICLRYRIRRLEVAGSAARGDDFDPDTSVANVKYAANAEPGLHTYFGAKAELGQWLGARVEPDAVPRRGSFDTGRRSMQRELNSRCCH